MLTCLARPALALALAAAAATPAFAQIKSPALAKELAASLSARQLDAYAVQDPVAENAFVAALSYPGVQLLVIAARHSEAAYLLRLIGDHNYRGIYTALQGTTINEGRLFVQDMGADGLRAVETQQGDIVYRGTEQTVLSGDVKNRRYREKLAALDDAYAGALQLLLDSVAKSPAPTAAAAKD